MTDQTPEEKMTLGRQLGRIVSTALAKELDEHRWFINWRTLDEKDQWTVDDFHGLDWQTQVGTVGSLGIGVVASITEDVKQLIEAEASRRELALLDELEELSRRADNCTGDTMVVKAKFIEAKRQALKAQGEHHEANQ